MWLGVGGFFPHKPTNYVPRMEIFLGDFVRTIKRFREGTPSELNFLIYYRATVPITL